MFPMFPNNTEVVNMFTTKKLKTVQSMRFANLVKGLY